MKVCPLGASREDPAIHRIVDPFGVAYYFSVPSNKSTRAIESGLLFDVARIKQLVGSTYQSLEIKAMPSVLPRL